MSPKVAKLPDDCSECDKVKLEKQLDAKEHILAFERELRKLSRQQDLDLAKLDREHANARDTAEDAATTELQKSRWQAELELGKAFHEKLGELAVGSIERSRDSAKYIQTAAAWIATLYTGLLALVFSVTDNPLPIRGAYAAAFLGLAVALAAAYLAFITKPDKVKPYEGGGSLTELQLNRTAYLFRFVNATVGDRRWAIRASVVSLAIGVAFIPAAFVARSHPVSVPDAPVAPTIPSEIATQVRASATELFKAQLDSYKAAVTARNEAIEKASNETSDVAKNESHINSAALWLALVGLVVVLIGPLLWGYFRDD